MITTLAVLAALTVTPAEETAIIQKVMDRYFLETARSSDPDAEQSLFIAETMADGELDVRTLIPAARSGVHVPELAQSIEENNRQPIALPALKCPVQRVSRAQYWVNGHYDWEKINLATGGVEAVVEVARPGFTQNGCVAVVRVVVRQPKQSYQDVYALERTGETWRLARVSRGLLRE